MGRRPSHAGAPSSADPGGARGQGGRLGRRRGAGRAARLRRNPLRRGPGPSAPALCAAQRRRPGGPVGHRARQAQVDHRYGDGRHPELRRRLREESQPHRAAARRRRRRQGRGGLHPAHRDQPALRHGPVGRPYVCRRHRRGVALSLSARPDHPGVHGREGHGPAARTRPLDAQPARQPGRAKALCFCWFGQQHRRRRHGPGSAPRRHPGGRSRRRPRAGVRLGPAQSQRHGLRAGDRRAVDRGQRARHARRRHAARLPD